MLVGNPHTFAIWFDQVDFWSTDRFNNGCFAYFIGGKLIWSLRSTLGVDLPLLEKLHCINEDVEDRRLFGLPAKDAYAELCARAFPPTEGDAEYSDYSHLVSAISLSDDEHYVFLIEYGDHAKLIYGHGVDSSSLMEIILARGEFQSVVREAVHRWLG